MLNRLIKLLKEFEQSPEKLCPITSGSGNCDTCEYNIKGVGCYDARRADYLLKNGVIAPPCKVGQTVFKIVKLYGDRKSIIVEGEVFEIALTHENGEIKKRFYFLEKGGNKIINRYSLWLDFDEVGKTVFLTKEEAEQALRKEDDGK